MINRYFSPTFAYFQKLINNGPERSIKAKKNILGSIGIKGISVIISVILVPLTLNYVDQTQYGVWLTLSSVIGWFYFFDIGFGNGLRNKFAESLANGEVQKARIYVSTTYAILITIISVVLILFLLINPFLNWSVILNSPSSLKKELSIVALIVFISFCLRFVLQLLSTIISANQQHAKASLLDLCGNLISLLLIYILTQTTHGSLLFLAAAFSLSPVLVLLFASLWFFTHDYRKYAPSLKYVNFEYAKDLIRLGIKFFLVQIGAIVLFQTDNIIIAQLFGPTQVTPFNISFKYFGILTMVIGIVVMPLWSAYTEAWVKGDLKWIKNTLRRLMVLWVVLLIGVIVMIALSDFVYEIWVGNKVAIPFELSVVIGAYVIINAWNLIYSIFLNGVGKIRLQFYSSIWSIILHVPMAFFLGSRIGVTGVVLSSVILGIINMVWTRIQYIKIVNSKAKGIWAK